MRLSTISAIIAIALPFVHGEVEKPLDIQVTHAVECERKSKKGDSIEVHYKGTLLNGLSILSEGNAGI
jgi:FK506-binding protein 2